MSQERAKTESRGQDRLSSMKRDRLTDKTGPDVVKRVESVKKWDRYLEGVARQKT